MRRPSHAAQAPADRHNQQRGEPGRVLDIRTYRLVPGSGAEFDRIFREHAGPCWSATGSAWSRRGPSLVDDDLYTLVRSFDSLDERREQLGASTGATSGSESYDAAVTALIETYHTVVIQPLRLRPAQALAARRSASSRTLVLSSSGSSTANVQPTPARTLAIHSSELTRIRSLVPPSASASSASVAGSRRVAPRGEVEENDDLVPPRRPRGAADVGDGVEPLGRRNRLLRTSAGRRIRSTRNVACPRAVVVGGQVPATGVDDEPERLSSRLVSSPENAR